MDLHFVREVVKSKTETAFIPFYQQLNIAQLNKFIN